MYTVYIAGLDLYRSPSALFEWTKMGSKGEVST